MKTLKLVSALLALLAILAFSQLKDRQFALNFQKMKAQAVAKDAIVIDGEISQSFLKTSNGCGIGNFIVPVAGDSSQGLPPTIRAFSNSWPLNLITLDTIPGATIRGVSFRRADWLQNTSVLYSGSTLYPYVVISDIGMFSYSVPEAINTVLIEPYLFDALFIPGITKMAKQITTDVSDPIVLYVKDSIDHYSLRFYGYPGLQEQFSFAFHFEPEIFEVTDDGLFITGIDTSGSYMLYHYSVVEENLLAAFPLNDLASNAQEFLMTENAYHILSSPGDSITMHSTFDLSDSTLSQSVVYPKSGARATHNEFKNLKRFTFQPVADFPDSILDKQIFILHPLTNQLDMLPVNLELDYFKQPMQEEQGFGNFALDWIGAKWHNGISDTLYLKQYSDVLKVATGVFPQFVNATYGCWVSVNERETEKIKFEYYPNPASSEVIINLSGLEKGKNYKLDIMDNSGRVVHTTQLQAYQNIQLPLQRFGKGIYYLILDTGKNLISKKLILQ